MPEQIATLKLILAFNKSKKLKTNVNNFIRIATLPGNTEKTWKLTI